MINNQTINELLNFINFSEKYCGVAKIISIDGPSGSGKTTLAENISKLLSKCEVVHMDEIYSGWDEKLDESLFNKLQSWIIKPIQNNELIEYKAYDWFKNKRIKKRNMKNYEHIIIEGVGSCNLKTNLNFCTKIWVEGDPKLTLERVLKRDGYQIKEEMKVWKEKEARYFEENEVKKQADFWLYT